MLTTLLWGLPLLALGWMAWTWNRLIALRAASHAAGASGDALLKRRANLIPNLVALVKGTMTFEAEVRDYNILRESFPNLIVARLLGFGVAGYFTIDDDERDAPGARL